MLKVVICSGHGWTQDKNKSPCHLPLIINGFNIYFRDHTDISGWKERYYGFICPICGCFTEINSSTIPDDIKKYAKEYKNKI